MTHHADFDQLVDSLFRSISDETNEANAFVFKFPENTLTLSPASTQNHYHVHGRFLTTNGIQTTDFQRSSWCLAISETGLSWTAHTTMDPYSAYRLLIRTLLQHLPVTAQLSQHITNKLISTWKKTPPDKEQDFLSSIFIWKPSTSSLAHLRHLLSIPTGTT